MSPLLIGREEIQATGVSVSANVERPKQKGVGAASLETEAFKQTKVNLVGEVEQLGLHRFQELKFGSPERSWRKGKSFEPCQSAFLDANTYENGSERLIWSSPVAISNITGLWTRRCWWSKAGFHGNWANRLGPVPIRLGSLLKWRSVRGDDWRLREKLPCRSQRDSVLLLPFHRTSFVTSWSGAQCPELGRILCTFYRPVLQHL